jgi:hypothetical protein
MFESLGDFPGHTRAALERPSNCRGFILVGRLSSKE